MNFEGAKENIQPLAAGRNVEQLEVALNAESQHECQEELLQQRRQFDLAILNYVGDDPLELWFEYIGWVEQSYPKSGKESALDDLLARCVSKFEKDPRYSQDPRFIRVFIKYIDTKKTPHKHYTKMYNNGLGTMVADLYIAWAHYFDVLDDFEQAKAVYQKGLDARAAPIEHLKQVYERFQFSVGQRVIRKEEYRQEFLSTMEAQRNAFTSLHSLKRSKVGSVRTGSAVKSVMPGRVRQDQSLSKSSSSNAPIKVYEGTSQSTSQLPPQPYRSVVEEIENSMIENHIEPGPWSKPSSRKSVFQGTHGNSTFKFKILEDDIEQPPVKCGPLPPDSGNLAINLPKNFVRKNDPQTPFVVPAYVEDFVELRTMPAYQKFYLHPNANVCFQSEELRWYKRLKDRGIDNKFTQSRDKVWGIGSTVPARVLANFPRQNQPQTNMETERPDISSIPSGQVYVCNLNALHPKDSRHELQFEEIMWIKYQRNRNDDAGKIDETVCVRGRQSFGVQYSRKSIAGGGRKSIMPVNATMEEFGTRRLPPTADDSGSDMDLTEDFENGIDVRKEKAPAGALIHKVDEFLKPQAPAEVVLFKKPAELPQTTQWSDFNDAEPVRMTDEKNSGSRFNTTDKSKEPKQNKETFTVPQIPLARTAEKRTTDSGPTMHADIPSTGRSQYPIGPQTGAVRKSIIRRSTISEHAVESSTNSNDTGAKLPDLDYSLCTQAFNVNLAEQMASTPVPIRRTEALTEQLRSQEIQPPKKLSIIMETTEGSASAASTKSSTQFSSPEDNDLSKSTSNVTNRTKLVGAATFTDDEATGACENNSISERMTTALNGTNHGAGVTNYSCNVEKTLPAIQLSILPDAAPVEQNKREITTSAAAKDEPAKNYPFPIFEDAETLTAIAPSMSSNGEPREPNGLAVRSSRSGEGQFNETSMWIKDEPKSFTLNDMSAVEESFVLPIVSPGDMSAPLVRTTASGTSAAEESFALPKGQRKSIAPPRLEANQTDSSADEESFALPNGNGNNTNHIQFKDEPEPDVSTADESFALPNRQRKSIAPATFANETDDKSDGFQTNESKVDPQMDNSASEVALPNETFSNKSDQTEEDAEMTNANGTFDVSSDSEEEVIEVLDETSVEDAPKIVNVQSLAKNRFETSIRISISFTDEEMGAYLNKKVAGAEAANCSIYHNSVLVEPSWIEDEAKVVDRTAYQEPGVNLEESKIIINTKLAKEFLDPFSEALKGAFLDEHQFIESLKKNSSCELISTVPTLAVKRSILFKGTQFEVLECIGHGAYGRVYHVKESKDGTTYAVKKEMPANLWELYILSALHSRVVDKLSGYMKVDMSIMANDGSLLFSQYSRYGTLLDVCNRVFSSGNSNINESIVFILAYQMLDIVDRLHKADILHLDLKPDNFLVMKRMSTNHEDLFIQIIDFGNAVDLRLYPKGQQFKAALETKHFVCLEMLEGRPWRFQPDLYCLAATIHSVLFGRYLDVKKVGDNYQANVKIPRYFNAIWGSFFNKLINIPEGTSPNLQELKECFEQVIVEDKNLQMKIAKFNQFIV